MSDIWSKSRRLFPQLDKYHRPKTNYKTRVLEPVSESFTEQRAPQMHDVHYHYPSSVGAPAGYDALRNEAIAGNPIAIRELTRMALAM